MAHPLVVNLHWQEFDVRCDRRGPWGNPFVATDRTEPARQKVIGDFREWVRTSDHPRAVWMREHVHELEGKRLGCHCAPKDCHCDVLAEMANGGPGRFSFGDTDDLHTRGNADCRINWCGTHYPKPCEQKNCKGLVHANFGDEDYDGYWLFTQCDVCGEPALPQ